MCQVSDDVTRAKELLQKCQVIKLNQEDIINRYKKKFQQNKKASKKTKQTNQTNLKLIDRALKYGNINYFIIDKKVISFTVQPSENLRFILTSLFPVDEIFPELHEENEKYRYSLIREKINYIYIVKLPKEFSDDERLLLSKEVFSIV